MYKNRKEYVVTGAEVIDAITKNTHRELEEGILGGLLLGEIAKDYLIQLSPDIFYYEQHKEILKAMIELNTVSKPINVITVGGYLKNVNKMEFVGGHYYLAQLASKTSGISFLETAIIELYELALRREAIIKTEILQARYLEPAADPLELLEEFQGELESLLTKALKGNLLTTDSFISNVDAFLKRTKATSVEVGLEVYDKVFPNGILWGSLNIIAARSGVGKTSLLTAMMMEALKQFPCLLVSYEMPESQMHYRMLRYHSNCELRGANADDPIYLQEANSFNSYLKQLQPFNFIGPERPLDSNELLSVIKTKANQGVKFIFIDYLTMIRIEGNEEFRLRIASFLRELKQLATRHSICIFLLSQLNRESTRGNNPRPQLSNLSESAAVEANADTVLLIYRPEYHGIGQWPEDAHPAVAGQGTQGQCELIAAKSRHQKGYSTVANCDLATNRFWPIQGGYTTYTQVEIAPF